LINILEKKEQDDITLREMALEEGYAEGRAKGHAEGHAEGHEAGVNEATLRIAKSLKDSNTPIEIISSATGLSKEEIENL
jgi:predicted transposase/invertase (TIGR01784 family)